jgi:hypothetical protein
LDRRRADDSRLAFFLCSETNRNPLSDEIIVQYVGFSAKELVREYTFSVREVPSEPRKYTLTIPHEAFASHRARYQDAPGICLLRLRLELATLPKDPAATAFCITDAELADYQGARKQAPLHGIASRRPD